MENQDALVGEDLRTQIEAQVAEVKRTYPRFIENLGLFAAYRAALENFYRLNGKFSEIGPKKAEEYDGRVQRIVSGMESVDEMFRGKESGLEKESAGAGR